MDRCDLKKWVVVEWVSSRSGWLLELLTELKSMRAIIVIDLVLLEDVTLKSEVRNRFRSFSSCKASHQSILALPVWGGSKKGRM